MKADGKSLEGLSVVSVWPDAAGWVFEQAMDSKARKRRYLFMGLKLKIPTSNHWSEMGIKSIIGSYCLMSRLTAC
jgi:hypothetical protein